MNRLLLAALRLVCAAALLLPSAAARTEKAEKDWRDSLTKKRGNFPKLRPLTAHYEFGWSGIKAAETEAKFSALKGGKFKLETDTHTVGAARALWRMNLKAVSTCASGTLRPIRMQQIETYSRKSLTTTVNFNQQGAARLRVPDPPDKTPPKVKKFNLGNVHDLHSALLFVRSQPLRAGDTIKLCVYPDTSPYLAEIVVAGREKLKAAGREWPAIRCDIKLHSVEKDFTLTAHDKFKRATAWLSDDDDRLLLRAEADIFIGAISAELEHVDFEEK
jgi:hypothetical protein